MRGLSKKDFESANVIIRKRLGMDCEIVDGCLTTNESGGKIYHIAVNNMDTVNDSNLEKVGEIVKENLNAIEVYCFGLRLA